MTNNRLVSSIVLVFLISSLVSLSSAANSGLPFESTTPTVAPEPTPTPTPKPEPTVWPTLNIHIVSGASANNPKVTVSGTLTHNHTAIPNASVYIGYSADCGANWKNFSWVQTHSDGTFAAVWLPNATGNYMLNVHWEGNDTLHWLDATANMALTYDFSGNEFAVISNSTIVDLAYNSTTQKLSFVTNGTSDTTGYTYVCIPKTALINPQMLQIHMDGASASFGSESQEDVWVISCIYSQSEHAFTVQIPFVDAIPPETMPWTLIVLVAVIVVVAVGAVAVVVRRRRRTAATVAAILKENRPAY